MSDVISDSDTSIQEKKACDGATVRGMCALSMLIREFLLKKSLFLKGSER